MPATCLCVYLIGCGLASHTFSFSEPPLSANANSLHCCSSVAAPSSVELCLSSAPSASPSAVARAQHSYNCATSSVEKIEQLTESSSSPLAPPPLMCASFVDESQDEIDPVQYLEQLVSSPPPRAHMDYPPSAAGRALCPATATGAPSAPEASGHPKWMPTPTPTPPPPSALVYRPQLIATA